MVQEAESHADEDKQAREMAEAKNQGDSLIHATEKAFSEHGDKVGDEEKSEIESAIAALKESVKTDDLEDIKEKTDALRQASMKLGEAMYKAQAAEEGEGGEGGDGGDGGASDEPTPDENVVDAEFSEVDDDQKKGAA